MSSNENMSLEPGALVQIKPQVHGAGKIGIVIGPATHGVWANSGGCLDVLLVDGAPHWVWIAPTDVELL
jgi:hypothetical protein